MNRDNCVYNNTVLWSRKLDTTKWILILLMVVHHIPYYNNDVASNMLYLFIQGDFIVPAFALISGFLFWRNVNQVFNNIIQKAKTRVFSLLIPYLSWNILNLIFVNLIDGGTQSNSVNLFDDIVLGNASPHFWYLFMLMFWTVLSPILFYLYRDYRLFAILLLSQVIYIALMGNNLLYSRFDYILYTWGGYIGCRYPDLLNRVITWNKKTKITVLLVSVFVYIFLGVILLWFGFGIQIKVWIDTLKAICFILAVFCAPEIRFFDKLLLRKYSFWVFAVHFWLDVYISRIIISYFSGIPYLFITFISVMIVAVLSGFILRHTFPWGYALLTGKRTVKN